MQKDANAAPKPVPARQKPGDLKFFPCRKSKSAKRYPQDRELWKEDDACCV